MDVASLSTADTQKKLRGLVEHEQNLTKELLFRNFKIIIQPADNDSQGKFEDEECLSDF